MPYSTQHQPAAHGGTPLPGAVEEQMDPTAAPLLARAQAIFYLITGIWPWVSITSFQKVTGPKTDLWLVKAVGALISVVGGVLWLAGRRQRVTPEIRLLAMASAGALTWVDVLFVARGRISRIYLLDAAAELGLIAGWALLTRPAQPTAGVD